MNVMLIALSTLIFAPVTRAATALIARDASYEQALSQFSTAELEEEVVALPVEVSAARPGNEIEPVPSTASLRLLGRGIAPRRGKGESLAIACYQPGGDYKFEIYDRDCPAVRFVWFKNMREAYYIGETIGMPGAGGPKLRKKALKLVLRDFFNRHQTPQSEDEIRKHLTRSFILLVGGAVAVALTLPVSATGAVIGGWGSVWKLFAVPIGIFFISTNVDVEDSMVSGTLVDARMTEADGWNWADKPKKIGPKKFGVILGQVVKGYRMNYDHNNREMKVRRMYDRLQKKGVRIARPLGF